MSHDHLEVTGSGTATAAPDHAVLALALEHRAADVATAVAGTARSVAAVLTALSSYAVASRDVQTTSLRLEEGWDHQTGRPDGYLASETLTVRLRDVPAVPRVLAACLEAGGDDARLRELRWDVLDRTALETRAREQAWQAALARATQLAELAGRPLGAVSRVVEGGPSADARPAFRLAATAVAEVAVTPGELDVGISLVVRWLLA